MGIALIGLLVGCGALPEPQPEGSSQSPSAGSAAVLELGPEAVGEVEALAQALIEEGLASGLVVGVTTREAQWIRGYGVTREDDPRPPDGATRFEVGSITKAFTGLLLAEAVARGEVTLEEPALAHAPNTGELTNLADVTLVDLATHTSGLPRMPPAFAPRDRQDPYAGHGRGAVFALLGGLRLGSQPGETYAYSNLGQGLLGELLVRASGTQDYASLLEERVARPLGLVATDAGQVSNEEWTLEGWRCAEGHDLSGAPTNAWTFDLFEGAGAIRSTMEDMLRFARSQFDPKGPAALAQQVHFDAPADGPLVGLGWHHDRRRGTVWHNGQTGGFHAWLELHPSEGVAVCVLSSSASGHCERLGRGLYDLLAGTEEALPLDLPRSTALDGALIEQVLGTYRFGPFQELEIRLEGSHVAAQMTYQDPVLLSPRSEDGLEWVFWDVPARLVFEGSGTGPRTRVTLFQSGLELHGERRD